MGKFGMIHIMTFQMFCYRLWILSIVIFAGSLEIIFVISRSMRSGYLRGAF